MHPRSPCQLILVLLVYAAHGNEAPATADYSRLSPMCHVVSVDSEADAGPGHNANGARRTVEGVKTRDEPPPLDSGTFHIGAMLQRGVLVTAKPSLVNTASLCAYFDRVARRDGMVALMQQQWPSLGEWERHALGVWAARTVLTDCMNKSCMLEGLRNISSTTFACGSSTELHGYVWEVIVQSASETIEGFWQIAKQLCNVFEFENSMRCGLDECYHAVGHAAFLHAVFSHTDINRTEYDANKCAMLQPNSIHLTSNLIEAGEAVCAAAPWGVSVILQRACLSGLYHSVAMYVHWNAHDVPLPGDWGFACHRAHAPALCLSQIIRNPSVPQASFIKNQSFDWTCSTPEDETMFGAGCVAVLSLLNYPIFDLLYQGGNPTHEKPFSCNGSVLSVPHIVTDSMHKMWLASSSETDSGGRVGSLVAWCDRFILGGASPATNLRRAMACIEGSLKAAIPLLAAQSVGYLDYRQPSRANASADRDRLQDIGRVFCSQLSPPDCIRPSDLPGRLTSHDGSGDGDLLDQDRKPIGATVVVAISLLCALVNCCCPFEWAAGPDELDGAARELDRLDHNGTPRLDAISEGSSDCEPALLPDLNRITWHLMARPLVLIGVCVALGMTLVTLVQKHSMLDQTPTVRLPSAQRDSAGNLNSAASNCTSFLQSTQSRRQCVDTFTLWSRMIHSGKAVSGDVPIPILKGAEPSSWANSGSCKLDQRFAMLFAYTRCNGSYADVPVDKLAWCGVCHGDI